MLQTWTLKLKVQCGQTRPRNLEVKTEEVATLELVTVGEKEEVNSLMMMILLLPALCLLLTFIPYLTYRIQWR